MSTHVLVTGGAGYIGSHACKALARAGHVPVTLDNLSRGHRWAVRWGPLVEGDIADRDRVRATIREFDIEAVMHFAAYAYVGESTCDPGLYFRNNVAGSIALLDAMVAEGVETLVFSSTCATYGVPQAGPISEDHPQRPVNPYGESKLFVERAIGWYGEAHRLRCVSLRYFNAAGADPDGEIGEAHDPETHLVPLALETALGRRDHLEIYGTDYDTADGTAVRDYVHVSDLADAHVRALHHLRDGGDATAINLGVGRGHSVREVVAATERVTGARVPVRARPRRAGDPPMLCAAAGRAGEVLGWVPAHPDLDAIVRSAWRWHRAGGAAEALSAERARLAP